MPLLALAVGRAAAVDETRQVALGACINYEPGGQLHHVEVGLPGQLGLAHAPIALLRGDNFACSSAKQLLNSRKAWLQFVAREQGIACFGV